MVAFYSKGKPINYPAAGGRIVTIADRRHERTATISMETAGLPVQTDLAMRFTHVGREWHVLYI